LTIDREDNTIRKRIHEQKAMFKGEPELLAPSHLLEAKVTGTGVIEELPASAFLFEMLTNYKHPWMGGE
jgi:hypothetical protein